MRDRATVISGDQNSRNTRALKASFTSAATFIDRFLPVLRSLADPVQLTGEVADALTIDRDGSLRVIWAPFDYMPKRPVLVLVGITPGRFQAEKAVATFRAGLRCGLDTQGALRHVKAIASFSGPLRANLVAMLDHIGLHDALDLSSCADLFGAAGEPVHFTSALRYPVFIQGANYSGTPGILQTPMLLRWVDTALGEEARKKNLKVGVGLMCRHCEARGELLNRIREEARLLPGALWVPLGRKPAMALHHLAARGIIDPRRILDGLPHPSGANAERIAFFLGRKSRSALSRNTSPDGIEAALTRLRAHVSNLRTGAAPRAAR